MTADEYCVFSLVVQLADWQTGIWVGSGVAVSDYLKWCSRKSQLVLRSLESKGYLGLNIVKGRKGNYAITVKNYHGSPNGGAVKTDISASRFADKAGSPNGDATLKEVKQEKGEEVRRAQNSRGCPPHFKRRKNGRELEGIMEITTTGKGPRKDYVEFLELRNAGKIPNGINWEKWRDLKPEERQRLLKAA